MRAREEDKSTISGSDPGADAGTRSLYAALRDAGIPTESRYSDLYVPHTPEAMALVNRHNASADVPVRPQVFRSERDGKMWIELPFAYDPFWDAKAALAAAVRQAHDQVRQSLDETPGGCAPRRPGF